MQLCSYVYDIELFNNSLTSEAKSTMAVHAQQVWGKLDMSVHLGEMRLNNLRYFPSKTGTHVHNKKKGVDRL